MEILNNPILLLLVIILSCASFVSLWVGIRQRDLSLAIIGLGLGIPTMGPTTAVFWTLGVGLVAGGVWLRRSGW